MIRPLALLVAFVCPIACAVAAPRALVERPAFDFGEMPSGSTVEHEYRIRNAGSTPLHIRQVALTPPLRVTGMPAQVAPGADAPIRVRMESTGIEGRFDARIVVFLDDPASPQAELTWSGRLVPPIEIQPIPAFYLAGQRGEHAEAALTIVNHTPEPLQLGRPEHSTERFTSRLATLEQGRRYRLTITLAPDGPGGRHADDIVIRTSNTAFPLLRIPANTYLRERVYAFPDAVDLGNLKLADIRAKPDLLERNAQTLMVYQKGGTDFRIDVTSDVPALDIKVERGPRGDRYQLTLSLRRQQKLDPGMIRGTLRIETNDPRFPRLDLPVSGGIIG